MRVDMDITKNRDRGHFHFLNSTSNMGDPPIKGPMLDAKYKVLVLLANNVQSW